MTSRLLNPPASPEPADYAKLVAEALVAFERDVMYAVQVAESARSLSKKKSKSRS